MSHDPQASAGLLIEDFESADSAARFRELADSMPHVVFSATADGRVDYYNRRWYELRSGPGADPADSFQFVHPADREAAQAAWSSAIAAGTPYEHELRLFDRRTQTYRWHLSRCVPVRDAHGLVGRWYGATTDIEDRKQTELALREKSERLQAALAASGTGTFRWDIRTGELTFDDNLDRLFGLPAGRTARTLDEFLAMVHPDDRAEVVQRCGRCRDAGCDFDMEYRVVWPDGSVHWLADKGQTFFGDDARPLYMTGACVDVTRRKEAELVLRESEGQFRRLADAIPMIAFTARPDGFTDYYNKRWYDYTGLPHDPAQDRWKDVLHPDDRESSSQRWAHSVRTGEAYENEYRFRRASDGQYRWHIGRALPIRDGSGRIVKWFGSCTDVHEHREVLDRLMRKRQLLAVAQEAASAGWFEWDIERGTNYWSPELEALYGLPAGTFAGSYEAWRSCVLPQDLPKAEGEVGEALRTGVFTTDFRIRRPDGAVRWMNARARVFYAPQGRPQRMVGINLDVTDRKQAEERADAARAEADRANRAKDEFLAALSHELRTPLTPVLMAAQLMEDDPGLPEQARADLRMIRRNVELETRLIDDLLDLTRISRGKVKLHPEAVDLHALARDALQTCREDASRKRLAVELDLAAAEHVLWGDGARVSQVLWNLLKNAVKFTPDGGRVTVRTENASRGWVRLSVSDTGVGIEPALLPHVFNAFEQGGPARTRRFGGLGLGLAIAKALAEMHGGILTAQSEGPGRGATFSLELPTVIGEPDEPPALPTVSTPAPRSGARLLLVEDHEQTARVIKRFIEGLGYEVEVRHDVAGALAAAAERAFDLVLSDIGLPDRTGLELMDELRGRYGLKGLALTGYGMEQDVASSAAAGFVEHLVKPVSREQLAAALRRHAPVRREAST